MHGASDVVLLAELIDGLDILGGELEVEAVEVALDAVGSQALGQDNVAASSVPVEEDLGGGLAVLLSDAADGRVLELVASGERRVRLDEDAVLGAEVDKSLALAEGVELHLVDGGDDLGVVEEVVDVAGTEVGDADGPDLAQLLRNLERTPASETLLLVLTRGVDEVEVKVVQTKLVQRVDEGVEGSLETMVGIPDLRADIDLLTGSASLLQPAADSTTAGLLVGITSGGVNVTVAGVKGGSNGLLSLLAVGGLVHA